MGHYTTDYRAFDTQSARDAAAIRDLVDYLGQDRFNTLTECLSAYPDLTEDRLALMVSFAGVQGFPVLAWFRLIQRRRACPA